MTKQLWLAGAAVPALWMAAAPAGAQVAAQPEAAAASAEQPQDIIVTGSARAQRRFDVSYAVNTLSQDDVRKLAPKSMTELVGALPGIHIEQTGGEVQNITRVRGIPTDRGYLYYQQDGLPLFHELDGFFFNQGDGMNRFDLMTDRVEVVRGGPAPIYASGAAAIVNVITRSGEQAPHGEAQVTLGTTGLYRLEGYQSGPLGKRTTFAVGGFYRYNDGYRDNGFPSDKGGQIRANILRTLDNGTLKISGQYTNDHNLFYLSIPTADPRDPSVSLDKYIDYFTGTLNTPALRAATIKYRDGAGALQSRTGDLANGRHMQFGNVALDYEGDFDAWHVSAKAGYTDGRNDFDALYSTSNPADGATFASSYLSKAQAAFGSGVTRMGYALAGTSGATAYDPATASGLVVQAQYRSISADFYSGQGDLSVTRKIETGLGTHDIRIGSYAALWGVNSFAVYQNYLMEVRSQPRLLDLVAYGADGSVKGYVTDRGSLNDAASLNAGGFDAKVIALYGADSWDVTERLRIDAGIRHEWYRYDGFGQLTTAANLGDATTLADDATRAFTGAVGTSKLNVQATNWTLGANYDFSRHLGLYARASRLEIPATASVTTTYPTPSLAPTKARLYEAGIKAAFGRSYLYVTGFYTKFDPLNASFTAFNPQTGRSDQTVNFVGTAQNKGVEADGQIQLGGPFSLAGSLTVQDPKYLNFSSNTGADGSKANGKQILREPKLFLNVRPTLAFPIGADRLSIYGRYDYITRRYVDFFNNTALPAYGYFGLGAALEHGDWRVQLAGDNLTNAHGLTEGNTAGDRLAGQGTPTAIFGRPLFGRNVRLIVSKKW
jgi:iron complex outermembrane recepter protein